MFSLSPSFSSSSSPLLPLPCFLSSFLSFFLSPSSSPLLPLPFLSLLLRYGVRVPHETVKNTTGITRKSLLIYYGIHCYYYGSHCEEHQLVLPVRTSNNPFNNPTGTSFDFRIIPGSLFNPVCDKPAFGEGGGYWSKMDIG